MAIIRESRKIMDAEEQYVIAAGGFAIMRVLRNEGEDTYSVMTATAGEETVPFQAGGRVFRNLKHYPDQSKLIAAFCALPECEAAELSVDHWGRKFAVMKGESDAYRIHAIGDGLGAVLGLGETIEYACQIEAKALHAEFGHDDDEDAYLMDGVYVTKDGRYRGL